MKKIFLNLLFLGVASTLFTQTQFNVTANLVDFEKFNETLESNDFPVFEEEVLNYSLLFTSTDDDRIIGSRGGFMYTDLTAKSPDRTSNTFNDINWRGIAFISGTDFRIINKKWLTFGPSIDLVIMQQRMRFINGLPSNTTFANLVASETEIDTYRNVRLMFDGRLNLAFNFGKKEGATRYGLGLTGGYRLDPFKPNWKYAKSLKIEIPGTKQSGLMIGLLFTIKMPGISPPKPKTNEKKS